MSKPHDVQTTTTITLQEAAVMTYWSGTGNDVIAGGRGVMYLRVARATTT